MVRDDGYVKILDFGLARLVPIASGEVAATRETMPGQLVGAATSLALLWQRQGKTAAARPMLAEIYGWFTEGFGTADLQDAKALLEDLSSA